MDSRNIDRRLLSAGSLSARLDLSKYRSSCSEYLANGFGVGEGPYNADIEMRSTSPLDEATPGDLLDLGRRGQLPQDLG